MVVAIRPSFRAVDGNQFKTISGYFDANKDGQLSISEMNTAASTLKYLGGAFGNDNITNIGNAFSSLSQEVSFGNRSVDSNGDRQISLNSNGSFPPGFVGLAAPSEMDTMIGRNNPNQFEQADLNRYAPPPPKTNFNSISYNNGYALMQYADRDYDGKVTMAEMTRAKSDLNSYGGIYKNYSDVYTRLMEEVNAGNGAVDSDGDRAISYRSPDDNPLAGAPFYYRPSEYETFAQRNNSNRLEVADMNFELSYLASSPNAGG